MHIISDILDAIDWRLVGPPAVLILILQIPAVRRSLADQWSRSFLWFRPKQRRIIRAERERLAKVHAYYSGAQPAARDRGDDDDAGGAPVPAKPEPWMPDPLSRQITPETAERLKHLEIYVMPDQPR